MSRRHVDGGRLAFFGYRLAPPHKLLLVGEREAEAIVLPVARDHR